MSVVNPQTRLATILKPGGGKFPSTVKYSEIPNTPRQAAIGATNSPANQQLVPKFASLANSEIRAPIREPS